MEKVRKYADLKNVMRNKKPELLETSYAAIHGGVNE